MQYININEGVRLAGSVVLKKRDHKLNVLLSAYVQAKVVNAELKEFVLRKIINETKTI